MTDVEGFFAKFNELWLEGRTAEILPLLHADIVVAPPGGKPVRGAEALVRSIDEFMGAATVHSFRTLSVDVEPLGDDLVCAWLRYEIDYSFGGERSRERAVEVWLLRRTGESWRALLREVHPAEILKG